MVRPLRIQFSGAVYHVTSRGNGKADIYLSDSDRELFLEVLEHVVGRLGWICHAYCLMTNHYHMMIETPKGNLSQGMRQLNGVYTQRFNIAHGRVGHLFQGRFKSILVEKDSHLLALCRYIVRNPVAAGMVNTAEQWSWSSFQATAGLADCPELLTIDWVLEQFGGSPDRYRQYVFEAIKADAPLADAIQSHVLGSRLFRDDIQQQIKVNAENPKAQTLVARLSLCELVKDSTERGEWMLKAYRDHGYTMREIACYANIHYSLVSKLIKASEGA